MLTVRKVFMYSCILFCSATQTPAAPLTTKEKPLIKCEITLTGKIGEMAFPAGGEVVITNNSTDTIDIGTTLGPLGLFDFLVKDEQGKVVKTDPLATFFSPSFEEQPHLLKPGEKFRAPIGLLVTLPDSKRVAGTYKVKGIFTYKNKSYESSEVEVKWPSDIKK